MSRPDPYSGSFDDWSDVQSNFGMKEKEPTQVLLADYNNEDYDGYATVVYRRGRFFYSASGSHCSCHGLEDQWDPEGPMSKTTLKAMIERGSFKPFGDRILAGLAR